jgi:hypothetical protein
MQTGSRVRAGQTLAGTSGSGRFTVLRVGSADDVPYLGGWPLAEAAPAPCSASQHHKPVGDGLEPGTRYVDGPTGLEIMCTEAGRGTLTYAGRPMTVAPPPQLR